MWKIIIFLFIVSCNPQPKFEIGSQWQIQFNGEFKNSDQAKVFDLDLFSTKESLIIDLHKQGKKVICYFSAGTMENWRPDKFLLEKKYQGKSMKGWEGEIWLDIRSKEVRNLMSKRLDLAKEKGCDAVDPDNVDEYTHDSGFPLSAQDQLAYNKFLAKEAHKRKIMIGLKNDMNQINDLVEDFDFSINESCADFNECELLKPFILKNKPILAISYQKKSDKLCKEAKKTHMNLIFKNKKLDEKVEYCD